jgi:hypothetical protein
MMIDPLPGWTPPREPRRLLVAGATGRFGEALLNEAIARRSLLGFDEVVVLSESAASMSLGISGLAMASMTSLPRIHAVIVSLSEDHHEGARSFHGRDAPFVLVDRLRAQSVALAAVQAGAQRLLLVHPLPVWQQLSGLHQGLVGEVELQLSRLSCHSMLMMRPLAQSRTSGGDWLQRIAQVYLSLQMLMMPRSMPQLTSTQLARAVVAQLAQPTTPGLTAMGAADIQAWLTGEAQAPKRQSRF